MVKEDIPFFSFLFWWKSNWLHSKDVFSSKSTSTLYMFKDFAEISRFRDFSGFTRAQLPNISQKIVRALRLLYWWDVNHNINEIQDKLSNENVQFSIHCRSSRTLIISGVSKLNLFLLSHPWRGGGRKSLPTKYLFISISFSSRIILLFSSPFSNSVSN